MATDNPEALGNRLPRRPWLNLCSRNRGWPPSHDQTHNLPNSLWRHEPLGPLEPSPTTSRPSCGVNIIWLKHSTNCSSMFILNHPKQEKPIKTHGISKEGLSDNSRVPENLVATHHFPKMPSRNLAYTIIYPIFKHYQTPHFHCQLVMPNPYALCLIIKSSIDKL